MRSYIALGALLLVAHSAIVLAQNPDTAEPKTSTNRVLHRLFLRHAGWLEKKAAENLAAGKSTSLRTVYMRDAGLTAEQNERLLIEVRQFVAELAVLDSEAARIIKESRGSRNSLVGHAVPPPPAALLELQMRKEQLTEETIRRLRLSLGAEVFDRLWHRVQERMFPHLFKKSLPTVAAQR